MGLVDIVRDTMTHHRMLAGGELVVAAVSGGVDSMVLLHVLAGLRGPLGLRLHAAHLDHGLRGAEGGRDATAVAAWAEHLGVEVTLERAGPLDRRGGSLQRAARTARYAFLDRVAQRLAADRIALGHNRDDLAETLLLNLLRGAGLRGLAGIPPVRGRIIRPLLAAPRKEIVAYAETREVPWADDASNRSLAYRRNRIRRELIPALAAAYNPRVVEALARTAGILRAEDEFLETLAREALRRLSRPRSWDGLVRLDGKAIGLLEPALRRRVLRGAMAWLPGRPVPSYRHVVALEAWAAAGPGRGRCGFLRHVAAWWDGGDLVLSPVLQTPASGTIALPFDVPTAMAPFGMTFLAAVADGAAEEALSAAPDDVRLDAAAAAEGLGVRAWRFGDRFQPLGLPGTKKLQDFFVDAKVPRAARRRVPLLVSGDRILWVVGHRIDERAKLTSATRRVLRVMARPDPPEAAVP